LQITIETTLDELPKELGNLIRHFGEKAKAHGDLINTTNKAKLRTETEYRTYMTIAETLEELKIKLT
jgi:hypothetical protein